MKGLRLFGYLQVYLVLLFVVVGIPLLTYFFFAKDIQSKETIINNKNRGVVLLDRTGTPFFSFYEGRLKKTVPLESLPEHIPQSVIAVEDKDFYSHPGFSLRGIVRSLWNNIRQKEIVAGGSTITQQLVKNTILSPEKSYLRKYQEIILAHELERRYSKKEILEMYLNTVYFGRGAFGIEEAADAYFQKPSADLTLAESALLAGLLPAPSALAPRNGNESAAKARQQIVLTLMREQGYISEELRQQAALEALNYRSAPDDDLLNSKAPHFAVMVLQELTKNYGEDHVAQSGFTVHTTIDLAWQDYAEQSVKNQIAALQGSNATNGAAVVIDPKTGEVKALVGSVDWHNKEFGKFNVVTSKRPPGSAFKPIVYAAGLEKRVITPASVLSDRPTVFAGTYRPQNYDRRFRGEVTVRRALANSLNVPAVEVLEKVGLVGAMEMAERLGISTLEGESSYGPSFVLGTADVSPLEMAEAYSVFANEGKKTDPVLILEIRDKNGKLVFRHEPHTQEIMEKEVAFLVSSILSDTSARRETFGESLTISRPAAVKTGTTENFKDAWTIGYTPSLVVAAWVGNNNNTPMSNIAGSLGAAPIWRTLMEEFTRGTPVETFSVPSGVRRTTVCIPQTKETKKDDKIERTVTMIRIEEYLLEGTTAENECRTVPSSSPSSTSSPTSPTPSEKDEEEKEKVKNEKQPTPEKEPTETKNPTATPLPVPPSPTPLLSPTLAATPAPTP